MTRCKEFYEKFDQLRHMAKEIKEYCEVDARESIRRFDKYINFCTKHDLTPFGVVPEGALRPLMAKRNENIAPIVVEQLKNRMKSDNPKIAQITNKVVRQLVAQKRVELNPPPQLPEGVFDVIYADPPWAYNVNYLSASPESHYPTMSLEEICDFKVENVKVTEKFADDAILFLWATNPKLEDALAVMEAWGFTYKTNMVWVKDKFGLGFYFRGQHELLLLAIKGDIPCPLEENRPSSVLVADVEEHSKKPNQVRAMIQKMYPNRKYLELFAREKAEGWEAWGNEVNVIGNRT